MRVVGWGNDKCMDYYMENYNVLTLALSISKVWPYTFWLARNIEMSQEELETRWTSCWWMFDLHS